MNRWNQKNRNYIRTGCLAFFVLLVIVCWQNLKTSGDAPALQEILEYFQGNFYEKILDTHMPVVTGSSRPERHRPFWQEIFWEKLAEVLPIQSYTMDRQEYQSQVESDLTYEMLMAREGTDEAYRDGERIEEEGAERTEEEGGQEAGQDGQSQEGAKEEDVQEKQETEQGSQNQAEAEGEDGTEKEEGNTDKNKEEGENEAQPTGLALHPATEPAVQISREKLNDFDYLIQNFYVVDKTTTIDGSQLNAQELLAKDLRLSTPADQPQILIHHTHSQEGYADSTGDVSTSIVAVGEYLTQLLREYGFNVIHDTGAYDVIDHQNAYSYAGPAVEEILAEHPSIEVVIDMHRDGIKEGHLVTEVNGKQTAKIMFFNGLSRTTANGDLEYLYNPYLQDNLAFSLQMKLAAEEYYPGFTRANYLKGYRYNLHYVPKSMLVEIGAQTNTLEEAMNAMEPLADLLHKVLAP